MKCGKCGGRGWVSTDVERNGVTVPVSQRCDCLPPVPAEYGGPDRVADKSVEAAETTQRYLGERD